MNRLAKAGQAIDNEDFETASSVLGNSSDISWVSNVDGALAKVERRSLTKLCGFEVENAEPQRAS